MGEAKVTEMDKRVVRVVHRYAGRQAAEKAIAKAMQPERDRAAKLADALNCLLGACFSAAVDCALPRSIITDAMRDDARAALAEYERGQ